MAIATEQSLTELGDHLATLLGPSLLSRAVATTELTIEVAPEHILQTLQTLRDDPECRFVCFIDICGVDYPTRAKRFDVVYHLLSPTKNTRIRIKVAADEVTPVPSCVGLFPAADWFEREAYDLFGILFADHPDLRRLLTDYGFDGYPLRKDFPLTGFVEVRWDDTAKRVVYEPVRLTQEFRNFDFLSPWEGTQYQLPGDEKAAGNGAKP
jgi:NADH-quinone oxidoreductase subunit C